MHGGALLFMVVFWSLVIGLVVFVFCRLYCPSVDVSRAAITAPQEDDFEREEVT